jgi:hypothetical protein
MFVRFSNGFSIPITMTTDASAPTSIVSAEKNPAVFYVLNEQIAVDMESAGTLQVFDIMGRLVYKKFHEAGQLSVSLTTGNGVYIVAFHTVEGENIVRKIII